MAMAEMPGPYDVREYACISRGVVTNTCPMAPYRGVSRPVITFALERLMDKAASRLGLDPVEMRRRNLVKTFPYKSATGLVFDEASYVETLEMAVDAIDIAGFPRSPRGSARRGPLSRARDCDFLRAHRLRHAGIRGARHGGDAGLGDRRDDHGPVRLHRSADRRIAARPGSAHHAAADHRRRARHIARRIKIVHGDTDRTPYGWGTFASRSLVIAGGATPAGGAKVRAKLVKMASTLLEASADDIVLEADMAARRRHGSRHSVRDAGARRLPPDPPLQGRDHARASPRTRPMIPPALLQCLPRRGGRGGRRDRPRAVRKISGGGGRRTADQSHDRRRADPRRRRAGHRQRAAGGDHLRRHRQYPHRHASPTTCRPPRARFRRSKSIISRR